MSSRHTRRKLAKAKQLAKAEAIVQAHKAWLMRQIVDNNKRAPKERDYWTTADKHGNMRRQTSLNSVASMKIASNAFFYAEPRASGGMVKQRVQALRAKGAQFQAADMLVPDSASLDGQALDGRAIREAAAKALADAVAKAKR